MVSTTGAAICHSHLLWEPFRAATATEGSHYEWEGMLTWCISQTHPNGVSRADPNKVLLGTEAVIQTLLASQSSPELPLRDCRFLQAVCSFHQAQKE